MRRLSRFKRCIAITAAIAMVISIFPVTGINTVASAADEIVTEAVSFSKASGYYREGFDLTLTAADGSEIYYTTDGNIPKVGEASTKKYTEPIKVTDLKGKNVLLSTKENAYKFAENVFDDRSGDSFMVYEPKAEDIDRAFIVRAIAVDSAGLPSQVSTRTYFVNNNIVEKYKGVAVMSLVADPDDLIDSKTGIYVLGETYNQTHNFNDANFNWEGKEAERPAYLEFFNGKGNADLSQGVGIRMHGGYSRRNQQKSMNIYFRKELTLDSGEVKYTYDYGTKNLKGYELIGGGIEKYKSVMIRNGGNDADLTKFQDVFIQGQVAEMNAGTQLVRPCIVYLNGEFWGLYNLTEKYSDNSMQYKYGVDNNNVVIYKDYKIDEGEDLDPDGTLLNEYRNLANLDMTKDANYKKFCDAVDIDSYIDYNATEVYVDNGDWWAGCTSIHNHLLWRVADPSKESPDNEYGDGKWRYCLFDTEYSLGILNKEGGYYSYSAWNRDSLKDHLLGGNGWGSSGDEVFAAAFKNKTFANKFMTRLLDLCNYSFEYFNSSNVLDDYVALYNPLIQQHILRWGFEDVAGSVKRMKQFLGWRQQYVLNDMMKNNFSVTAADKVNLTISQNVDNPEAVTVNDMKPVKNREWKATYYKKNIIRLKAKDVDGCSFDHWDVTNATIADNKAAEVSITLANAGNTTIKAVYVDAEGNEYVPEQTPEPTVAPTLMPTPTPEPTATPRPTRDPNGGGWWPWATPSPTPKPSATPTKGPEETVTTSPVVTATPTPQPAASATPVSDAGKLVDTTKIYTVGRGKYRLDGKGGVVFVAPTSKAVKSFTVPASVKIEGKSYKVVEIAKKAFANCKKLKKITIKSTSVVKVGASAFKGIYKKAVIKVPKASLKMYKKIFKGKGQSKTTTIK